MYQIQRASAQSAPTPWLIQSSRSLLATDDVRHARSHSNPPHQERAKYPPEDRSARGLCQARRLFPGFAKLCALMFWAAIPAGAQTVFLDFNAAGQYTNNFNPWNDTGGVNGGNYSFSEGTTTGVAGGGGVNVFQNSNTTAAYKSGSWNFATG